jgi:GT2 family glycosyltransferase
MSVRSIHRNFTSDSLYEIVIVGNNIPKVDGPVKTVEDNEKIEFLGARKNIGTKNSDGDVIVHCDDDMIFPYDWYSNFLKYNDSTEEWEILGNKLLLPDGGRHWDRATFLPSHRMVSYDYDSTDAIFYQTGGFSICKRSLLDRISWSDDIPFYGMFKGFDHNEDVDFSLRLHEAGVRIKFDKNNTVWHYDFSYHSNDVACNKKKNKDSIKYKHIGFLSAISNLSASN